MSQQLRAYFNNKKAQENAKKFPQPNELVIWEGRARFITREYVAALIFLVILGLSSWVVALTLLEGTIKTLVIVLLITALVFCGFVIALTYSSIKKRYVITSERLIIQTINGKKVTAVNCKFSQILDLKLKNSSYIPHIELLTPYRDIPTTLYPAKNLQEFYEALSLLWQFGSSPEEKARLQRLYYPPWKPWINFSVFSCLMVLVLIFLMRLPMVFKWGILWELIFRGGWFLLLFVGGEVLASFFLGKEFSFLNTRVNTKHRLVQLGIISMFILTNGATYRLSMAK